MYKNRTINQVNLRRHFYSQIHHHSFLTDLVMVTINHKAPDLPSRHWPLGHPLDSLFWVCEHSGSHPRMALHSGPEIGVPTRKRKGNEELVPNWDYSPPHRKPHSLITSGPLFHHRKCITCQEAQGGAMVWVLDFPQLPLTRSLRLRVITTEIKHEVWWRSLLKFGC